MGYVLSKVIGLQMDRQKGRCLIVPVVLLETCFLRIVHFLTRTCVITVVYSFMYRSQIKVS